MRLAGKTWSGSNVFTFTYDANGNTLTAADLDGTYMSRSELWSQAWPN